MKIKRIFFIAILTSIMLVGSLGETPKPAHATQSDPNSYDTYVQNWTGYRPIVGSNTIRYNQVVANRGADSYVEAVLSAQAFNLVQDVDPSTGMDEVNLGLVLSANGRYGINYNRIGPYSISYGVNPSATDTGIHCDDCGAWINLPFPIVFFGAPAPDSGVYGKIWVSSNGFIALSDSDAISSPAPAMGPTRPNGVIAPFWRDLNPAAGGRIVTYTDNSQNFIVWWDQIPTKGGSGALQSFLLWIHDSTPSQSPYWQNWLEFWYGTITPNDGVNTQIGIEDQYGRRGVTFSQSEVSSGQGVGFKASSGPMYINSFKIDLADISILTGGRDSDVTVVFDRNKIDGYNVLFLSAADIPQIMPEFAKLILGGADYGLGVLGLAVETPIIGYAGLIVGGVALGIDVYDYLVRQGYSNVLSTIQDKQHTGDSNDANIQVTTRTGGANILGAPVDASLAAKLKWQLHDASNTVPHRLVITATIGYSDSNNGADIWSVSTNVQLDMLPSHKLFSWDFEGGNLGGWTATDANPASGIDTWGTTSNCPTSSDPGSCFGTYSAWSAQTNDGTPGAGLYDSNMDSSLTVGLGNLVGYSSLYLYFKAWIDTEQNYDYLYVDYQSGGTWRTAASYNGRISTTGPRSNTLYTQWVSPKLNIPSTTTSLRFRFVSDSSVVYRGVYLDEIYLFGDGSSSSYDVTVRSNQDTGTQVSGSVSEDGGASYGTPAIFLTTSGQHSFTVPATFTAGLRTYNFLRWDDSSTSTTRTVSNVASNMVLQAIYQMAPADFGMSANPTSITILRGSTSTSTITLTSLNAFSGTISLTATSCSGGPTVALSAVNIPLVADGSGTSTLTISTTSSTTVGLCTVTVTGTSGSISHSSQVSVSVQDFTISASTTSLTFKAGGSGTSTISLTSLGGFSGTVNLSPNISPVVANGPTVTLNPASVSLSTGSGSSTLTISTTTSTPAGSYTVRVDGTRGSLIHSTTISVTVTADFTVTPTPSGLTVGQGTSGTSAISLNSQGFTDTVSLSASVSPVVSNGPTTSFTSTTLSLTLGSSASSALTISTTTSTPPGNYNVTITATGGGITHTALVTVYVPPPDFTLASSSTVLFAAQGSYGTVTLTLQTNPSFSGTITLSGTGQPSGTTLTLTPAQLTLGRSQSGSSTLTISASTTAPIGSYVITVTGTGGSISHTVTITLKVVHASISFSQTLTFVDTSTVTVSSSFTVNTATSRTLSGTTTFTAVDTTGVTVYSAPVSMTITYADSGQARFIANVPMAPYWMAVTFTVDVTTDMGSPSLMLTRTPDIDHSGAINIIDVSIVSAAFGSTPGSSNWNPAADLNGDNAVNILDVSLAAADFGMTVFQPPFATSASSPSPSSFLASGSATSTVTINSYTLSGTVTLSATVSPSTTNGPNPSFNPISVSITPGTSGTATLTIYTATATPAGAYSITVKGTSGSSFHLVRISITVTSDFGVTASTGSMSLSAGRQSSFTVTVQTYGIGFSGTLTASISPLPSYAPTVNPGTISVNLGTGGGATYTFTVNTDVRTPQQGYTITVTGTSGGITRSATVSLTVTAPPGPPGYSFPATFTAYYGSTTTIGARITVCQGATVYVRVYLTSGFVFTGPASVEIRKDIVASSDISYVTFSQTVTLNAGTTGFDNGPFTASDLSGGWPGNFRQYFIKVSWNGQVIYDPTDPNTREEVSTNSCAPPPPPPGGGGSVAAGTLITLADGSQVPVQDLRVGMQLLSYDMTTHQYVITTITRLATVVTDNQMVIQTATGKPLIVDQNPGQKLYVRLPDGTVSLMSVTDLRVGYELFDALSETWTPITAIHYQNNGTHVMYDIYTTDPGSYIANGYLDPVKL